MIIMNVDIQINTQLQIPQTIIGGEHVCKIFTGFSHLFPVNIRNVFKWFKHLQNVFKTHLNPILWFSKRFQVNVYAVMFKKFYKHSLYKRFY